MALDFNNLPSTMLDPPERSALDLLRRMLMLRWSRGNYLSAIAGNYGVKRPPIGFSDDELFRSVSNLVMAQTKGNSGTLWKILEIFLGPYTNLVFQLDQDAKIGDTYLTVSRGMNFADYSTWNTTPFVLNEDISNGSGVTAKFKYLDTSENRIYFHPPARGSFSAGDTLTGGSGGSVSLSQDQSAHVTKTLTSQFNRMPLLATGTLNKGLVGTEDIELTLPDFYRRRIRLRSPLIKEHAAGDVLWVEGGCWEVWETQARRLAIKIKCSSKLHSGLPGRSYFHRSAWASAKLRESANSTETLLKLDTQVVQGVPAPSPTSYVLIDPEERFGPLQQVEANAYDANTRQWTLSSGLPAGTRFPRGTEVRWIQTNTVSAGLTQNASIGATEIKAVCRYTKDQLYGVWTIQNNELVFFTDTTYQRRQLTSDITPTSIFAGIDIPLDGVSEGTLPSTLTFRVWDTTGLLGTITVSSVFWYINNNPDHLHPQLGISVAPTFSTDIKTKPAYVELVDLSTGEVTITLSRALTQNHTIGDTLTQVLGTASVPATDADHLPLAGWPPSAGSTGQWPGPYLYDPSERGPINIKASTLSSILAMGEVAQDANDGRVYMSNQQLVEKVNPATAPSTLGTVVVPVTGSAGLRYDTIDMEIDDASFLPTTTQINTWRSSRANPNAGHPIQLVVGGEGGYNKPPVYYWGKGTTAAGSENVIYVSGVQLSHGEGTRVRTTHTELPISAVANVIGNADGLPVGEEGYLLLDHTRETQEVVKYDRVDLVHGTRGNLVFTRNWEPSFSHDPFATSNIDSSVVVGTPWVRSGLLKDSYPLKNGYSFSTIIEGDILLLRIAFVVELARAAGVKVTFYDADDNVLSIPALDLMKEN